MTDDRAGTFPVGASITLHELEHDPAPTLARLRAAEPVSWVPALGGWIVSSRDLAVEAMRDATRFTVDDPRFTTAAVLGPSMLSLDGPEHDRHRAPFSPAYRPTALRNRLDAELSTIVDQLLDAAQLRRHIDLAADLAAPLAARTITLFLGLHDADPHDVLGWYQSISRAITDLTTSGEVDPADRSAVAAIRGRVMATIHEAPDSLLASVASTAELDDDEIVANALVQMFGAIETAEGMTANAFWHLFTTPEAWATIAADRSLVADAIEESLRLEPAASLVDRYTTADVALGGITIPAGELVSISLLGANRDPATFPDPDRFDLTRPNARQHVSFVQGPHACIGHHMARMETAAAIDGVLGRWPDLRLDEERSSGPTGLIFRKPGAVVATF